MRPSVVSPALVLITSLISTSNALQALTESPCAIKCGNVLGSTNGEDDIACLDKEFQTESRAKVFEECVTCQLESKFVDPVTKQTDLQWALYNLRYAVSWCLYGYPNNTNVGTTPCYTATACGTLENAFEFDSLSPKAAAYGYCGLMDSATVVKCTECLYHSEDLFPANYVTALSAACEQQPIAGQTISIEGSVFSKTRTNITDPSQDKGSESDHPNSSAGLTLGARVGIAVGAIAVALTILGCCIIWNGKRRRRAVLKKRQRESGFVEWTSNLPPSHRPGMGSNAPHQPFTTPPMRDGSSSAGGFFDSPQSQRPLHPWATGRSEEGNSPASAMGEKAYFSPYSSQYTSPVSATEQVHVVGQEWPSDNKFAPKGFEAGRMQARSRSRDRKVAPVEDQIEMQNVPPVLLHPGNGRGNSTAMRNDAWRGNEV